MNTWSLTIPDFLPCTANQLLARVGSRPRLKRGDRDLIAWYGAWIPRATGKRRVSVVFCYPPRQRMRDCDAMHKSLLDALVKTGLLVDDHPKWCELGPWSSERGERRQTMVMLEDVA